jgi:primosomal protein N'
MKGFKITCNECGFEGTEEDFEFFGQEHECELCGSHGKVRMSCQKCKNRVTVEEW